MKRFELWDTARGNQLGVFASRAEAFSAVLSIARAHSDVVRDLLVDGEDDQGNDVFKAAGEELLDLAKHECA